MLNRLDFLEKHGYLKDAELNKENYRKLLILSNEVLNFLLKFVLTKNSKIYDKIKKRIEISRDLDREATEVLLNSITEKG